MISLPLYTLLFIYVGFLAVFCIFMAINFYHIVISSSFTMISFTITFFNIVAALLTIYFTLQLLQDVQWHQGIVIFNSAWLRGL